MHARSNFFPCPLPKVLMGFLPNEFCLKLFIHVHGFDLRPRKKGDFLRCIERGRVVQKLGANRPHMQ